MSDENKAHEDEEEDLFEHSLITALVSMAIGEDLGPEGDVTSHAGLKNLHVRGAQWHTQASPLNNNP